jgi:DnaJ-class molecular chaperone
MPAHETKADYITDACPTCRGTGAIPTMAPVRPGEPLIVSAPNCPTCGGTGRTHKPTVHS